MSQPLNIRNAQLSDVSSLFSLFNDAYHAESGDIAPGFKTTTRFLSSEEVAAVIERGPVLVAELNDGSIAGALAFELVELVSHDGTTTLRAHFGPFSTCRNSRGSGVGSALLRAFEIRARAAGATSLDGEVVNLRFDLFPIYFGLGFRVVGRGTFPVPTRVSRPVHFVLIRREIL